MWEVGSSWSGWDARGGVGEAVRVGCCWVPAADAGMAGKEGERGEGRGVRRAGEERDGEGRGARGDWAGSEEPMDADGQAIKGLWCWVDGRFGGGVGENGQAVDTHLDRTGL